MTHDNGPLPAKGVRMSTNGGTNNKLKPVEPDDENRKLKRWTLWALFLAAVAKAASAVRHLLF